MKVNIAIVGAVCLLCASGSVLANDCRPAEEAIAEMSVNVADAHGAGDVEKAKPLVKLAETNGRKGAAEAKDCGCATVNVPLAKAEELLKDALELGGAFTDVQDRLYAVIGQSELARRAAEVCWRQKVQPGQGKK